MKTLKIISIGLVAMSLLISCAAETDKKATSKSYLTFLVLQGRTTQTAAQKECQKTITIANSAVANGPAQYQYEVSCGTTAVASDDNALTFVSKNTTTYPLPLTAIQKYTNVSTCLTTLISTNAYNLPQYKFATAAAANPLFVSKCDYYGVLKPFYTSAF